MSAFSATNGLKKPFSAPPAFFVAALAAAIFALSGCSGSNAAAQPAVSECEAPPYASYRDIPGVTEAEVHAIEALRGRYRDSALIYGVSYSTEAFTVASGEVRGFAALVSGYMSKLFGFQVKTALYDWDDLIAGLESGAVSFSGDLTPTEERRRKTYFMTDAIATRWILFYRLEGSEPLQKIAASRALRYGFLDGSTTADAVRALAAEKFEPVFASNNEDAYNMLKDGRMDAFFEENPSTALFGEYGGLVHEPFLPLIYEPIALTAHQNRAELAPVISVMQKLLTGGGRCYLNHLYNLGQREYTAHQMAATLTEAEKAYIEKRPIVYFAAEYDNYPLSFYNANEHQWQGIMHDVLREVEALTGITFEIANGKSTEFSDLMKMLEEGKVAMISELIRSKEREGRFLWPDVPVVASKYVLVSKSNRRNVNINEIYRIRVGVQSGTAYAELFNRWFPNHAHVAVFDNTGDLFDALERDEVDMVMTSQNQILAVTHYMERPGYKINMLFNHSFESVPGFNMNEGVLCSVVGKAFGYIDMGNIDEMWHNKTYDYRVRLAQSRQPLLIGISALLLCVVLLLLILFRRNRDAERRLGILVEKRTAELDERNKLMEAVTKNYKGVIWSVDKDGIITMFNGQYLKTIGVEPSFLLGKNLDLARRKNRHMDIISNVQKTLDEGPQDWLSVIDGGTFHSNTMPVYDAAGNVTGVTGSTDDITEMVRLSHDLEVALETAKAASRAKSAFLANMSHEIRTPMNSVVGFAELALDYEMHEKSREYLGKILENSNWLLQIINDILDVSKIEAGKMTLESIPFDLCDVFTHCQTTTGPKALEKGLALHFYAEPFVGRKLVGDPTKLCQVFINLISNAIKFTNIGTVKASADVTGSEEGRITLRFEVRDSGVGMTPGEVEKVLEPFAQADDSITRKYGGTGLGLSIIKGFIELMGGKLTVDSAPGIGSRFSFELTFDTVDVPEDDTGAGAEMEAVIEKPNFDGEILVCEDNGMNQEVIKRHLERIGLRAVIAENGKIGVDTVQGRMNRGGKMFDLILMDINMPVMDGLEASEKIMALNPQVPIVAMTANVMSSDRELYDRSGMHDCVGKPFTSQELWRCLLRYLKQAAPKPAGRPGPHDPGVEREGSAAPHHYDDDLMLELSTMFVNDNQNRFADFMNALSAGDVKSAHRIAHTLKSNAGTIGKPALQKAALAAEMALKDGANTLAKEQIDTLETELNRVLWELLPLRNRDDDGGIPEMPEEARARGLLDFADELEALLRKGNPDSLKFKNALRTVPGSGKLVRQMDDFDFDEALETLAALKKEMERHNG